MSLKYEPAGSSSTARQPASTTGALFGIEEDPTFSGLLQGGGAPKSIQVLGNLEKGIQTPMARGRST